VQYSGCPTKKEDLYHWICLALRCVLTAHNIKKGFEKIGIWPLNAWVVDAKTEPFEAFHVDAGLEVVSL
jgi:hypothetical protein